MTKIGQLLKIVLICCSAVIEAGKKFEWKRVKTLKHKRLTGYGTIEVCGIGKGVEPRE